ncbi:MAG: amidohydrolase [Lachnospiraceae bacterium]|nr:amidohydrolase [Lachnospiraceae bacterium]MBP1585757.1 amidohydrolase [Lachnospiraceae bacterium]
MKIRLYNARILDLDNSHSIRFGEVHVSDSLIEKVIYDDERDSAPVSPGEDDAGERSLCLFDSEIDCKAGLLMRGFNNAHTHSAMTFLRSLADDKPTPKWLKEDIFPNEARLTDDDIADFSRLAIMEYVSGGTVSAMDMYLRPDVTAEVFAKAGMRAVIVSGLNDFTSSLESLQDEFKRLNEYDPLIGYRVGFHAEYTTGRDKLERLSEIAASNKCPVFCHLSETRSEVEECVRRNGETPLKYLDSLGLFDNGGGIYHGVHLTDEEMDIAAEKGIRVVINSGSNCKLASGIAPLKKLYDKKVKLAIGTDGPASNNSLNMFKEMYLTSVLCKLAEDDAACMDASFILDMAVKGSAECMGLEDSGLVAPGKPADLILLDLNRPNMQPLNNIVKNIVYAGSASDVIMTMCAGRILYRNGEYDLGFDPDEMIFKCSERTKRILSESI